MKEKLSARTHEPDSVFPGGFHAAATGIPAFQLGSDAGPESSLGFSGL